ncbi:MAG: hypothetical protein CVV27_09125 [Candidatus Melainabacteria bacterium HGW-Melainabacteria-1]|nr:MAG: hypothetical protein CVV27_09125 [Candidatus Melainabacteria bacterium HGW-Melainabacteria-1]
MYEGWLYQPGSERRRVTVHSAEQGLQLEQGEDAELWPYAQLAFSWGGAETRMIAIGWQQQRLYVSQPELLLSLRPHLSPAGQTEVDKLLRQLQGRRWQGCLGLMFGALLLCGLLAWGGVWLWFQGRELAIRQIPVSWEAELGQQVYTSQLAKTPACDSAVLRQGLAGLEARLEAAIPDSPYDLRFEVVKSDQVNAFALPGGRIALHAALVAKAPSPEALMGVMAHEAQHVLQRHGLNGLVNRVGITLLLPLLFGDSGTLTATLAGLGGDLLSLDFSRSQESEADQLGLQLLSRAGVDPKGMAEFFRWMASEESKGGAAMPAFLSTHPLSSERQQNIEAEIRNLPARAIRPLELDWQGFQAAAKACL